MFHAPHYVLPPLVRVPIGRDDPRLHPPDVSAVPAEPRGATRTRARRCGPRRTRRDRILTVSEARSATSCTSSTCRRRRSTSSTTPSTSASGVEPTPKRRGARPRALSSSISAFVLYAGNIKPHKNLERLIEAFAELRKRGLDDLKLVIIGDEISKLPALRRAVHSHKLHKLRALPRLPAGRHAGGALSPGRACSSSRRSTKASGCRRSKRWRAARRS